MYDYDTKQPLEYGAFSFPLDKFTYAKVFVGICDIVKNLMFAHNISAVFIEDIQMRKNVDSFKKLAQLQGALVSMFERNEYLYDFVPPSSWQNFCNARGRTTKEVKDKMIALNSEKKRSKLLSIQFVKDQFGIDTNDDNIADAVSMGYYVAMNVKICALEEEI